MSASRRASRRSRAATSSAFAYSAVASAFSLRARRRSPRFRRAESCATNDFDVASWRSICWISKSEEMRACCAVKGRGQKAEVSSFREVALPRVQDLDAARGRRDRDRAPAGGVAVALVDERVARVDVEEDLAQLAVDRRRARARDHAAGIARALSRKLL